MWDSSHIHTHHTINQIGVSQSLPLKSLTSSLGPILWGSVSEPTRDYRAGFDTICNDLTKSASHICTITQKDQSLLRLLVVVNKAQIYPVTYLMWDSLHTHTHHKINQIGVSQCPPLKSLTSLLGPTLWGSVFMPTWDYRAGSNTVCNDPRKSVSHIYAIPSKDQSPLRLLVVVNKAQFNPINTRCETHHTPTHITQSIKLWYHNLPHLNS